MAELRNKSRGRTLAFRLAKAESFVSRLTGLMGRKEFPARYDALLFEQCNSIHCFFMFMAIDVLFIDKKGTVVKCISSLRPWRLAWGGWKSSSVIELPAGTLEKTDTRPGDQLELL